MNASLFNVVYNKYKITIILDEYNEPVLLQNCETKSNYGFKLKINYCFKIFKSNIKKIDIVDKITLKKLLFVNKTNLIYNERFYISISGLYSLIMSSKKEEAIKFKKWVTKEVLPSIKKYGDIHYQKISKNNCN